MGRWVAESGEPWSFNGEKIHVTRGIEGDAQEGSFMNATLQTAGKHEFSVAVHVDVPPETDTEEALADYLGFLFTEIVTRNPELTIEVQLGPAGDGTGE